MRSERATERLGRLAAEGRLRFTYVVALARSNSTIVCRLLGRALDGAVYEPATPAARSRDQHWARTILRAYDLVREGQQSERPVCLAIKDLSVFLTPAQLDFVAAHAAHVVFTIRDPARQHASLKRQLRREFTLRQRIAALKGNDLEIFWYLWHGVGFATAFARAAAKLAGWSRKLPQLIAAGWTLTGWTTLVDFLDRIPPDRRTILDADAMRADPEAVAEALADLARTLSEEPAAAPVEVSGHHRMQPGSAWAAEALTSSTIKPLDAGRPPVATTPIDEAIVRAVEPDYERLLAASLRPSRSKM